MPSPVDYRRLAAETPNLAARKNTGPNVLLAVGLMREAPELQHFVGEATFPIGCLGECSLLSSFGPIAPVRTRELFESGRNGEWDWLFRLHKEYLSTMTDVLAPMCAGEWMDGAYDKVISRLAGPDIPLRLASPYRGFPESVYERCRAVLREKYADWAR